TGYPVLFLKVPLSLNFDEPLAHHGHSFASNSDHGHANTPL
ncbi:MAG: hypothetical protein ACI9XZ_003677, partial [Alphaproteobacteria bacterium]